MYRLLKTEGRAVGLLAGGVPGRAENILITDESRFKSKFVRGGAVHHEKILLILDAEEIINAGA